MDTPEAPHAHSHVSTGKRWLDLLVGFAALGISALSIIVAVQHGRTMEKLVEAQSWPHVQIDNSNFLNQKREVAITLRSAGAGPARIEQVTATYAGRPVRSWVDLLRACCSADSAASVTALLAETDGAVVTSQPDGMVLLPGDRQSLLVVPLTARNAALWRRLDAERFRLRLRVCYCSVFDECFVAEMGQSRTRHVATCTPDPDGWSG